MTREEYIVEIAEKIEGMKEKNIYIFGITKATVFLANYLVGRGVKYIGLLDNNQQKVNEYNEMFSMLINYEKDIQHYYSDEFKISAFSPKQIKNIDETINNKDLLQQEYIRRNEDLPLEKKIFSMRILSQLMAKEREEKINKIEELNRLLNPQNFVEYKRELEQKQKYLKILDTKNIEEKIEKLKLEEIRYKSIYKSIDDAKNFSVYTSLENDLTYYDQYRTNKTVFDMAQILYKPALYLLPLSIIAVLVLLIMNCFLIGLRNENGEVILNAFDKTPLLVALIILFILFMIGCGFLIALTSENLTLILSGTAIGAVIGYISFVFFLETIIKRIKSRTLFRNTITYRILRWIKSLITSMTRNANMTVKLILIFIAFGILNIIGFSLSISEPIGIFILIAIWVYAFAKMHQWLVRYIEIKNAINEIYMGNTEVHLDEKRYKGSLNSMAIQVNDIAGGLSNAIQEKLKSERLKTELITNVSHDIKTPLTSIINYVDLLKKEKMPNEQAEEYLNILDNKSQRLKRLTEDLVEASKASSGNIKLNIEKLNVNELLKQVSGEFEDKFKSRNLEEVMSLPEKNVYINADSRYMYRILENMYSNISKYAMDNTRVYIDVIPNNNRITIQMKNISKQELNISADELMQRFVRGETSRNTEGSGLGLSIASSLTELQGGKFHIYLDGDLFKVTIGFEMLVN